MTAIIKINPMRFPERAGARRVAIMLAVALATTAFAQSAVAGALGFLKGTWRGGGSLVLDSGKREKIRCHVKIDVTLGGTKAVQTMRCASTGRDVFVESQMIVTGQAITGNWRNTVSGENGSLNGATKGQDLKLRLSGPAVSANLRAKVAGKRQSLEISGQIGPVRSMTVSLMRLNL